MTNRVIEFVLRLAFAALDRWLSSRIEQQGWDQATEARAKLLALELERFLEPILGELAKVFAGPLARRAFKNAFPNDPSTGNWG